MAFPELPDDRRARPRRYRGGADEGDPGVPDDRPAPGPDPADGRSGPSRHRAVADDPPPAREPGRRRLRTDDDPRPNGNGSHGSGRPPADRLRDAYPYAGDGPDGPDRDAGRPPAVTSSTPYSDARRAAARRGEDPYPPDLLPDAGPRERSAHRVSDVRDDDAWDDGPRAPREDRPRRPAPPDAGDRPGERGRRTARHQGRPGDPGPGGPASDPDGDPVRGGRPSWDEPGGFPPDDAGRRRLPDSGPGPLAAPSRNGGPGGAPGRNGAGPGPSGSGPSGSGPNGFGPSGSGANAPGPNGPGRNGSGPGPVSGALGRNDGGPGRNDGALGRNDGAPGWGDGAPGRNGAAPGRNDGPSGRNGAAPGRNGSAPGPYGPNGAPFGPGPASGPDGAPFGPPGGPNGSGPNGSGPGSGPGGGPDGPGPNGAPTGRRRRLDQDDRPGPAALGRPVDDAAPPMPPPRGPRGGPPPGRGAAPDLRPGDAPPGARRPAPPRPGVPGPPPYEESYEDEPYDEYDDVPEDGDDVVDHRTRAVGTRDPVPETTTARARAPGRRTERERPGDEWSDEDWPDDEDADEDDDPRVGKRAGPVGIGGRLSALTSRRNDDGTKKPTSFWKELPLLIGVALVLTFLIQTFVAKVFVIPSGSMETTLHGCTGCTNDRVLVDKVTYNFTAIAPGDVVVFRGPPAWANSEYEGEQTTNPILRGLQTAGSLIGFAPPDENDFVKRVIAVGGQTVACCDALNQVMVDGQPLSEPYIYYLPQAGPARQIPFGPIKVPDGELWVMGDSRNNSADARAHGPVPEDNVIGKVRLIVLPFTRFGWVDAVNPQTTASAAAAAGLPQGSALALGMMGAFPFALGRRRSLRHRADEERFLPVTRRRERWRRSP